MPLSPNDMTPTKVRSVYVASHENGDVSFSVDEEGDVVIEDSSDGLQIWVPVREFLDISNRIARDQFATRAIDAGVMR